MVLMPALHPCMSVRAVEGLEPSFVELLRQAARQRPVPSRSPLGLLPKALGFGGDVLWYPAAQPSLPGGGVLVAIVRSISCVSCFSLFPEAGMMVCSFDILLDPSHNILTRQGKINCC